MIEWTKIGPDHFGYEQTEQGFRFELKRVWRDDSLSRRPRQVWQLTEFGQQLIYGELATRNTWPHGPHKVIEEGLAEFFPSKPQATKELERLINDPNIKIGDECPDFASQWEKHDSQEER